MLSGHRRRILSLLIGLSWEWMVSGWEMWCGFLGFFLCEHVRGNAMFSSLRVACLVLFNYSLPLTSLEKMIRR